MATWVFSPLCIFKVSLDPSLYLEASPNNEEEESQEQRSSAPVSILDVTKEPILLRNLLLSGYLWVAATLGRILKYR